MKVGHILRAERIRQEMKQIVLAKGICTPSYLSKIERNLIYPSEDVIALLFSRLNMDMEKIQKNNNQIEIEFEKTLKELYKQVIINRDENFTKEKLDYLETHTPLFENRTLYYTYLLVVLRLRIILKRDSEKLQKEIEHLERFYDDFNLRQTYLLKLNKSIFHYTIQNRKKTIEHFEEVLAIVEGIVLEDWEKAELNYMLGLAYTVDGRISISIDYIRKALEYFRENLSMKRVLDCYILIGITQKKSERYQDAFDSYMRAKQICDEFRLQNEKGMVYHNLGSLASIMGNSEEAIRYYEQSLPFKTDREKTLISILCLVIEYSKRNDKALVNEWCNKGDSLLLQSKDENLASYHYHFTMYKSIHSKRGLSEKIAEQAISHFKTLQDYRYVHKYSIALADWYFNNKKYKLSSIYYQEANRYGNVYRKIKTWEDS